MGQSPRLQARVGYLNKPAFSSMISFMRNTTSRFLSVPFAGVMLLGCAGSDGVGGSTPTVKRPRTRVAPAARRPAARRPAARRPAARPAAKRRVTLKTPPARPRATPLRVVKALSATQLKKHVAGNNAFARALYDRLRRQKGNLFFSPFSVTSALAMVRPGAAGKSLRQLAKIMQIRLPEEAVHRGFNQQVVGLNSSVKGADNVRLANSLWGQLGTRFGKSYLARIRRYYGAPLNTLDFAKNAIGAARRINVWVSQQTKKLINKMIDSRSISGDLRLMLINAIYFKAAWKSKFKKSDTAPKPFFLDYRRKRHVVVPMMYQLTRMSYYKKGRLQIGVIPYRNPQYSMVILTYRGRLSRIERQLRRRGALARLLKKARSEMVELYLPKFTLSTSFELSSILSKMGLREIFSQRANLKLMAPDSKLFLSRVLHRAYLKVNEEGTVAAAATAALAQFNGSDHHPRLSCDSPFLLFIRYNPTGLILFAGRVSNPNPGAKIISRRPGKMKRLRPHAYD